MAAAPSAPHLARFFLGRPPFSSEDAPRGPGFGAERRSSPPPPPALPLSRMPSHVSSITTDSSAAIAAGEGGCKAASLCSTEFSDQSSSSRPSLPFSEMEEQFGRGHGHDRHDRLRREVQNAAAMAAEKGGAWAQTELHLRGSQAAAWHAARFAAQPGECASGGSPCSTTSSLTEGSERSSHGGVRTEGLLGDRSKQVAETGSTAAGAMAAAVASRKAQRVGAYGLSLENMAGLPPACCTRMCTFFSMPCSKRRRRMPPGDAPPPLSPPRDRHGDHGAAERGQSPEEERWVLGGKEAEGGGSLLPLAAASHGSRSSHGGHGALESRPVPLKRVADAADGWRRCPREDAAAAAEGGDLDLDLRL